MKKTYTTPKICCYNITSSNSMLDITSLPYDPDRITYDSFSRRGRDRNWDDYIEEEKEDW